jgi:hypothetical protein
MEALARRVHARWREFEARHHGRRVPVGDTLSRILEHDPEYEPFRPRSQTKRRSLLRNPGVFTLKKLTTELETTVGDLLGEPAYERPLGDVLSPGTRRSFQEIAQFLKHLVGDAGAELGDCTKDDSSHGVSIKRRRR